MRSAAVKSPKRLVSPWPPHVLRRHCMARLHFERLRPLAAAEQRDEGVFEARRRRRQLASGTSELRRRRRWPLRRARGGSCALDNAVDNLGAGQRPGQHVRLSPAAPRTRKARPSMLAVIAFGSPWNRLAFIKHEHFRAILRLVQIGRGPHNAHAVVDQAPRPCATIRAARSDRRRRSARRAATAAASVASRRQGRASASCRPRACREPPGETLEIGEGEQPLEGSSRASPITPRKSA